MVERTTVTAARALADILVREGVEVVFGLPGGPVMPLYDQLLDCPSITVVLNKHEQAAAYAAFTYARLTGKLGVCVATLGPGATNLLAGIPIAYYHSTPVLAITGQVQTTAYAHGAHQESTGWFNTPDQEAMYRPTVKHTVTCNHADRFPDYVRHSIRIAFSGRMGPTHLIVPANLLHQPVDYSPLAPAQYRLTEHRCVDEHAAAVIAGHVNAARCPLLFVGERVMLPDATAQVQVLAESFALPVMTDLASKSAVDETSPMNLGTMGVMGHKAAERYLKNHCDLVLAIGQTFNEISTLSWDPDLAKDNNLIQIDSVEDEIAKVFPVRAATVGHLPSVLHVVTQHLAKLECGHQAERQNLISQLRKKHPLFDAREKQSKKTPMLPQRVVADLQAALPDDALVLADSSKWARWLGRYLPLPRRNFLCAHDYEPMGWAVAGALGARFATDKPVICVTGDGAFQMHAMELATAANHDLDVLWLVMNDERLGIIHDLQTGLYGKRYIVSDYRNPDFVQFAQAFGIHAALITEPGRLTEALIDALSRGGPGVLDIRFDPDELPPVRPRSVLITEKMGLPKPKPSQEVVRATIKLLKDK